MFKSNLAGKNAFSFAKQFDLPERMWLKSELCTYLGHSLVTQSIKNMNSSKTAFNKWNFMVSIFPFKGFFKDDSDLWKKWVCYVALTLCLSFKKSRSLTFCHGWKILSKVAKLVPKLIGCSCGLKAAWFVFTF